MKDLLRILIAPTIWLASFSAVYGLHGLICGLGIQGELAGFPLPRLMMAAAYALAIVVQLVLVAALHAPRFASESRFVHVVSRATGWTGLVATIWSLLPTLTTTYCL